MSTDSARTSGAASGKWISSSSLCISSVLLLYCMPALYNWATTDVKAVENVIASHFIRTYRQELTKARELRKIPANVRALLENCGSRPLLGSQK